MNTATGSDRTLHDALAYVLEGDYLWDVRHRPEIVLLAARLWSRLDVDMGQQLLDAVLAGSALTADPVRSDFAIGHLLLAMEREFELPERGLARLAEIRSRQSGLSLSDDNRELFPVWHSSSYGRQVQATEAELISMSTEALAAFLQNQSADGSEGDSLRALLADHPERGLGLLSWYAGQGDWPPVIWRDTLLGLDTAPKTEKVFLGITELLLQAPPELLGHEQSAWAIGWWLPGQAKWISSHLEPIFLRLWDRLASVFLTCSHPSSPDRDPLTAALNEPSGRLAEALLWRWDAFKPGAGAGMPTHLEPRFRLIARSPGEPGRIARVMTMRSVSALFRNDSTWVKCNLLGRLSWSDSAEAAAMWRGLLGGGRLDPDLLAAIKSDYLDTLGSHANEIVENEESLWQLFVSVCLTLPGAISVDEARAVLTSARDKARTEASRHIGRLMPETDAAAGAAMWRDRVKPWFIAAWPKDRHLATQDTAENLAIVACRSGDAFPDALVTLQPFLLRGSHTSYLNHLISETDLPERFPTELVELLDSTLDPAGPRWEVYGLPELLARTRNADASLAHSTHFRRIRERLVRDGSLPSE